MESRFFNCTFMELKEKTPSVDCQPSGCGLKRSQKRQIFCNGSIFNEGGAFLCLNPQGPRFRRVRSVLRRSVPALPFRGD